MNTNTLLVIGGLGVVAYFLFMRQPPVTVNPVAANSGATYVPPAQAVPSAGGWPSPAAPGAFGWGAIPQQPTDAQQAAQVITAIGGFASGIGSIIDAANG